MLQRFQAELSQYLGVPETNLALFNNGTLALELGYYAMGLSGGDVITTPFTFVATSHALRRIGANPVFADIDPQTMCLSPEAAEKMITLRTKAIVPVHVYGNVCDVEGFERLGEKYGVKIIYDAAHAFGVFSHVDHVEKKSIGCCGDMSMFSFHPTKLFHSCEGGLLVFKDAAVQEKLYELRNFAIHGELSCTDVGSNAKMNELQALMGLECLKKIDALLAYRQKVYKAYEEVLVDCSEVRLVSYSQNKAYVPVLFKDLATRERVYTELKEKCNVFSRRYFYPLLTDFVPYAYGSGSCPVAEDLASRVLTLPTYFGLPLDDVRIIAENVKEIVCL
jgi:Predicted pyridoxal phosphate-dependent enzyme apparently involved in regulation of cell wall biogenesis